MCDVVAHVWVGLCLQDGPLGVVWPPLPEYALRALREAYDPPEYARLRHDEDDEDAENDENGDCGTVTAQDDDAEQYHAGAVAFAPMSRITSLQGTLRGTLRGAQPCRMHDDVFNDRSLFPRTSSNTQLR